MKEVGDLPALRLCLPKCTFLGLSFAYEISSTGSYPLLQEYF